MDQQSNREKTLNQQYPYISHAIQIHICNVIYFWENLQLFKLHYLLGKGGSEWSIYVLLILFITY